MSVEARLQWHSPLAAHADRLIVDDTILARDARWVAAGRALQEPGGNVHVVELDPAPWCEPAGQEVMRLPAASFRLRAEPVPGRFYPRLAFADLADGPHDLRPVRLLEVAEGHLRVDPNHPLSRHEARLSLRPSRLAAARDVNLADLFDGPGMQCVPPDPETAYFVPGNFDRGDAASDAVFYEAPRLLHHLDACCRAGISELYGRFLHPGMVVLDLMSSWVSHLPEVDGIHLAGLGMNPAELAANPRLNERVVKDLNERCGLPWADGQFDLVVCTASIEYLVRPAQVLGEVHRVLKHGGMFLVTFSDRWFPSKAVRVWGELHPFERVALVLSLLRGAGFVGLHSETLRGAKRPADDKHAEQRGVSDPLFAAWGAKSDVR